jgi:hypothetical protein
VFNKAAQLVYSSAVLVAIISPAYAQKPADQMAQVYQAARNQLGILMFCQDKGFVGADIVEIQKKMLGMIPVPASKTEGDAAEAQGKKGTLSAMGVTSDIEAMTKAQGSTLQAFCTQIGTAIKQAGASLPK